MNVGLFHDPVMMAPTWGAILMCLSASLVGVIAFVRQRSLVGEALSHATYPGVILGAMLGSAYSLVGAFVFALLGLMAMHFLQKRLRLSSDAALCAILTAFLGLGVLLASRLQFTRPMLYSQVQVFLYGQSATMVTRDLAVYAGLAAVTLVFVIVLFQHIKVVNFDRDFASCCGISTQLIDVLTLVLLALAVVIGLRSVGVVLMSGMLVAPAVAARRLTHKLSTMLIWAAVIGMASGLFGTLLSVQFSVGLPTGPMIVLLASAFSLLAMLFAPGQGLVVRHYRIMRFKRMCKIENDLKLLWKMGACSLKELQIRSDRSLFALRLSLLRLSYQGFVKRQKNTFSLSLDGVRRASQIIRLHRLWEVYLPSQLGIEADKLHRSAEEMEHILTPELEVRLTKLLRNPKKDPHAQPIPSSEVWQ